MSASHLGAGILFAMSTHARSHVIRSRPGLRPAGFAPLRTGALVEADAWEAGYAEDRHVLRAYAVDDLARTPIVLSHTTAAAWWGLPLVGVADSSIHCIPASPHSTKTRGDVIRHDVPLPGTDVTELDGLRVTTLSRTVYDVIRMLDVRGGLACFDAAARMVAWSDAARELDPRRGAAFIESVRARVHRGVGSRGIRNARLALELVDGRAQLPGESISRLLMWELGMPTPELQLRVETHLGVAYLDFAWPRLGRFGEFDGDIKLTDPEFTRGRSRAEVLEWQAARRDAVEAATSWRGMHWGWGDIRDADTFASALRRQGWLSRG